MKKISGILAILMLLSIFATAMATTIENTEYTDVPTAMTQDSVLSAEATEECNVEVLQPDQESIALLDDVYRFVWEDENRPARYYDEETQEEIQQLCGNVDIDVLHMTEAMRLQFSEETESTVTVTMKLDADYAPGQLVIVVLGIPAGDLNYTWYPYQATVSEIGVVNWDIPAADWMEFIKQPISFHLLTVRMGPGGESLWGEDVYADSVSVFSKESDDVIRTYRWYTESGEVIDDDFRLFVVDLTEPMQQEVLRIGEHLADGNLILDYFPEERKNEALLMLPEGTDEADLMVYDVIALMDEAYKDTYGDINTEMIFGTAYDTEKPMVVLAGFVNEDAQEQPFMDWYVLRAEAIEIAENETVTDFVRIGLRQLNLPQMEEEPLMLVVISQTLESEE